MVTTSLIQFIASSSIIMASLTFLAKRFIDKSLDAAIERYKSTLQQELEFYKHTLNQETEKLKFELNKVSLEHQIRYNSLYQERGEIIKQTYSEIIKLENELIKLTTIFQGSDWIKTENNFEIKNLIFQFEQDFETKRLFFENSLCDNIESLIEKMKNINHRMYNAKLQAETNMEFQKLNQPVSLEERLKPKDDWRSLEKEASNDIKKIRRELERNFAKLIGVD